MTGSSPGEAVFHSISTAMAERMRFLEARDAQDRIDGTLRSQRLRQVPPETGKFLALLAAAAPAGAIIEIGTSGGYSGLWLALAARASGRRVVTFETLAEKVGLAQETFRMAGVEDVIDLVAGDARPYLVRSDNIGFAFLDAEKEIYGECYELIVPRLVQGGLLVADNAINHRQALQAMLDRALGDERVDAMIVPIGKGELVCRRI
jgi:caffeoyl-CoA O-methyltransferase